jgi:uncharacterized membrane protein
MNVLLYLYIGAGLLLAVLAIPLIFGKVPPNPIYGMRTSVTLSDPKLWYPANRYTGKWLFGIGIGIVIAALGLYLIPGLSVDVYALSCLAVFVVLFGVGMWRSFLYLRELQNK